MGKLICGIDDAGRGPVIGPMIMAGVILDEEDLPKLREVGVKDSKLLTQKQREKICYEIKKIVKEYKIVRIYPEEIDKTVMSNGASNLNWLEAEKMAEIINELKPEEVIIDCPSTNLKAFHAFLSKKLKVKTNLSCYHKAERFFHVGAASILAKCAREEEVKLIKEKVGECGSGYPADPITQKFLKENWNKYPEIFRHSWSSYQVYSEGKKSKKQKTLGDY